MKRRFLVLLALAVALVAMPALALGDSSRRAANSTTFPDSIGEDAAAPDITSVVVSNTDAGLITFQINVSNRPALTPDMFFLIFLDTDQNASTGSPDFDGADYIIELDPGTVTLFQWNGSDFLSASAQTSLVYSYAATGPTIRISAAELGKTKGLRFSTFAVSGVTTDASGNLDLTNTHRDAAPDPGHGMYAYQVLTKLILSVTGFTTAPKPAKAGRSFSASLSANENDIAGPVQAGTVGCSASIAFKRIVVVTHVLANGVASCVWRIPATAKGKVLRGAITLTVQGVKVTRSFSSRIG
ncbi:MAG TPA: hypothetical protein VFA66_05050 [Gaiellaceae bacterium]|nr:hypothetical protein [Gaiellaceae bacterium]